MNTISKTMTRRTLLLLGAAWVLAPLGLAQDAGYKVIANTAVAEDSLGKKDLSRVFLKKTTKWGDGTSMLPVDLDDSTPVRAAFSRDVHRKGVGAIAAYWQRQIFSGRGVPPVVKKTDAEVLDYVRSNPGAIGYVSAGASTDGVKVLKIQ
jgi:ABC-type phosphate transport system substrate-binding protein